MQYWGGKIILITGAGSGLGRALANMFAREKAVLILTDIDHTTLQETVDELGDSVMLHRVADSSSSKDWVKLVSDIEKMTPFIDVVINNAGLAAFDFFDQMSEAVFDRVMQVNINGVVLGCRHTIPLLEKSERGMIVNISSIFGLIATPMLTPYHTSKFAVRGFSEGLRQDLMYARKNIDVVCVIPGGVQTNIAKNGLTEHSNKDKFALHFRRSAMTSPEKAVRIIEHGMRNKRFRVLVGADAYFVSLLSRMMPVSYFRIFNFLFRVKRLLP